MFKKFFSIVLVFALCISVLGGCGEKEGNKNEGVTEVSWYILGTKKDSSYDRVLGEVNKLMEERYNIKIDFVLTDYANFGQKIQMMNASQEAYDLVFTAHTMNSFHTNVANGSLYDITELLPKHAPELYKSLSDAEKAAVTVDGKMYAVPNWQTQAYATGLWFEENWLKEAGFTPDDFETIEDLEKFLKKTTEIDADRNIPDINWTTALTYYNMATIIQDSYPGVINFKKDGKPQVINQYETEEFMNYAKLVRDWVKKGYIRDVFDKNPDYYMHKDVNRSPAGICRYMLETEGLYEFKYENPYAVKQIGDSVVTTQGLLASCTGIGAFSKNPEAAVKVLEIMHTDKEIFNMVLYGIEGENYDVVGDNLIHKKENNTYSISHWLIGSQLNSYVDDSYPADLYVKARAFNDTAIASPLVGFTADTTKILAQLGNCETVIKERFDSINRGLVDPGKAVPEFIAALKTAGVDEVIKELQKQVDDWWETTHK